MRIIKDKKCVDILCNKCGNSVFITQTECRNACDLIEASTFGNWSSVLLQDLTKYQFSLCEKCLVEFFSTFKIPVKITNYDQYHPRFQLDYLDDLSKDEPENFDYLNDSYFGQGSKYYLFKVGQQVKKKSGEQGKIYDYRLKLWEDKPEQLLFQKENRRYQVGFKWFVNEIDTGQIRYEILEEDEIELV